MAVGHEGKTIIPEHLASIHSVVLAFITNKQANTLNYIIHVI